MSFAHFLLFQMNLVVYSDKDLKSQWEMVTNYFSKIPVRKVSFVNYTHMPYYKHLSRIVIYYQNNPLSYLSIMWQTPSLRKHNRYRIYELIENYMEHRGNGSIGKLLQSSGLATKLYMDNENTDQFNLFHLSVLLTNEGLKKCSHVVSVIYKYINILKSLSYSQFILYWKKYIQMAQIKFDFLSETDIYTFIE